MPIIAPLCITFAPVMADPAPGEAHGQTITIKDWASGKADRAMSCGVFRNLDSRALELSLEAKNADGALAPDGATGFTESDTNEEVTVANSGSAVLIGRIVRDDSGASLGDDQVAACGAFRGESGAISYTVHATEGPLAQAIVAVARTSDNSRARLGEPSRLPAPTRAKMRVALLMAVAAMAEEIRAGRNQTLRKVGLGLASTGAAAISLVGIGA